MKNKTGIFIDISLTIVSRQNKSKIQHIKFQDLINTVTSCSSKYKHRRLMTVNITRIIHNHDPQP